MVKKPRIFVFTCQNCGRKYEHLPTHCRCGSFDLKEKLIRNPNTLANLSSAGNGFGSFGNNHFKSALHR